VCWCDGDGSPRYDCDERLMPAESMEDPEDRLQGEYRVFTDSLDPG